MPSKNRMLFQFIFSIFVTFSFVLFFYSNKSLSVLSGALIPLLIFLIAYGIIRRLRPGFLNIFTIDAFSLKIRFFDCLAIFFLLSIFIFFSLLLRELNLLHPWSTFVHFGRGVMYLATAFIFFNIFFFCLTGFGKTLLARIFPNDPFDDFIHFALGLVVLSLWVFFLGICRLFYPSVFLLLFIVIALISWKNIYQTAINLFNRKMVFAVKLVNVNLIIALIITIFLAFLFVGSAKALPIDYDGLHIYYNVIQLWLENHSYFPIYNFATANASQLGEMILIFILGLANSFVVSYTQLFIFIGCILLIYQLGGKVFNKETGLYGALIFTFLPSLGSLAVQFKVDMLAVFFFLVFIYCLVHYYQTKFKRSWLLLSGCMAGAAVSVKYTNLIYIGIVLLVIGFYQLIRPRFLSWKKFVQDSLIFLVMLTLTLSPWLMKNIFYFQKPFFPFSFGQKVIHDQQLLLADTKLTRAVTENRYYEFTTVVHDYEFSSQPLLNFLLKIWHVYTLDKRGYLIPHSIIGPFFLIAFFYFLFQTNKKRAVFLMWLILLIATTVWYVKIRPELWYLAPVYGLSCLLIGALFEDVKKFVFIQKTLRLFVFFFVINTFAFFTIHFSPFQGALFLADSLYNQENLKSTLRTSSLYRVSQFINENIVGKNPGARILSYPDSRITHIRQNHLNTIPDLYGVYFAVLVEEENSDIDRLYRRLKQEKITHLLLSRDLLEDFEIPYHQMNAIYYGKLNPSFNTVIDDYKIFRKLMRKYGRLLYCTKNSQTNTCDPGYALYELL